MQELRAAAWSVGTRLVVRKLDGWPDPVSTSPLTLPGPAGGFAVLFRFGAVAAVGLDPETEQRLLRQATRLATEPRAQMAEETGVTIVQDGAEEGVDAHGNLVLNRLSTDRAQIAASVLAKSAVLSEYEAQVEAVFERIEPMAALLRAGRLPRHGRALLREVGDVLLTGSRMVGRAEVSEKPETTWDKPDMDLLYERFAKEYELRDREQALTRKLDLIFRAASTYLDLQSVKRMLRVEWYIVLLIVMEILLLIYDMSMRG